MMMTNNWTPPAASAGRPGVLIELCSTQRLAHTNNLKNITKQRRTRRRKKKEKESDLDSREIRRLSADLGWNPGWTSVKRLVVFESRSWHRKRWRCCRRPMDCSPCQCRFRPPNVRQFLLRRCCCCRWVTDWTDLRRLRRDLRRRAASSIAVRASLAVFALDPVCTSVQIYSGRLASDQLWPLQKNVIKYIKWINWKSKSPSINKSVSHSSKKKKIVTTSEIIDEERNSIELVTGVGQCPVAHQWFFRLSPQWLIHNDITQYPPRLPKNNNFRLSPPPPFKFFLVFVEFVRQPVIIIHK